MDTAELASQMLPVLYEDEDYVFVSKPAGLRLAPATRAYHEGLEPLGRMLGGGQLYEVLSLDTHVSGIAGLARTPEAAEHLKKTLAHPKSALEYEAIVDLGPKRVAPKNKKRGKKAGSRKETQQSLTFKIVRQRRGLCLISFAFSAARTAEVRASLKTAKLKTFGEPKVRLGKPKAVPTSRIYIHRSKVQFLHPSSRERITLHSRSPKAFATALTAADRLDDILESAVAARFSCLLDHSTDSYRLFTGKYEGCPGLVVEKIGPAIVMQIHQGKFQGNEDRIRRIGKFYIKLFDSKAVYVKHFSKASSAKPDSYMEPDGGRLLLGKPVADDVVIRENNMNFLVRPDDGQSIGLFLDQRDNRRRIRAIAKGKRVLNGFAYTCGFSVAAALGKAEETVSVDISTKSLEWGKRNFQVNNLSLDSHYFLRTSFLEYLGRAARQSRSFDIIIIDAPTFARTKKPARTFSIATDFDSLLIKAMEVLSPGGILLASTNSRTHSLSWLGEQVHSSAAQLGKRAFIIDTPPLPTDFQHDRSYAKTILARITE